MESGQDGVGCIRLFTTASSVRQAFRQPTVEGYLGPRTCMREPGFIRLHSVYSGMLGIRGTLQSLHAPRGIWNTSPAKPPNPEPQTRVFVRAHLLPGKMACKNDITHVLAWTTQPQWSPEAMPKSSWNFLEGLRKPRSMLPQNTAISADSFVATGTVLRPSQPFSRP